MASTVIGDLLGDFLGDSAGAFVPDSPHERTVLGTAEKALLAATAITGYVISRLVFTMFGLPAVPGISGSLLVGPMATAAFGVVLTGVTFMTLTLLARPIVKRVRADAPVFCAAVAVLALPTHGGDLRNVLLDAGGRARIRPWRRS